MAEALKMPRLSDTMEEAVIVKWHKKAGDKVKPGDVLAEVETDKATMEMESYQEGTLLHIVVGDGQKVAVEGIIAVIGKEGEDYASVLESNDSAAEATQKPEASKEEKPAPAEKTETTASATTAAKAELPAGAKVIRMPLLSDTMVEGKIVGWNKKVGDFVKADDAIADVETDKATMELVGYEEGTLLYVGVEDGGTAKVNEMIAIVGKEGTDVSAFVAAEKSGSNGATTATTGETKTEEASSNKSETQPTETSTAETNSGNRIKASPLAKKLAQDKGIDLSQVKGTGDGGRVTKKDIENYKETAAQSATGSSTKIAAAAMVAQPTGEEGHTDIPLTQMRKVIARRLSESKFAAPHFYLTMEINMDQAIQARAAMNEVSPVKISFNDLLLKACATALRQHPDVNSSFMGDFIRQNHHIHIGSALALPEGLIVPVIKFADQKTLSQIAEETKMLYQKARDKKIQPNEFSGNTFTISNLGMMDIDEFTAVINPPDSCILAVGKIKEVVVKKGDGFGVENIMKLTLSCDHRSVDGAVGASFLQTLKKYMENPVTMLV